MLKRALLALLVVSLSLAACGAPAQTAPTATPGPAVVRLGWKGSPDSLNPGVAVLVEAYTLFALVYDSLYLPQLDGSFKADLAENAQRSDDGLTWTFTIRSGVKFHDGQPLTAKDVAFSLELYRSTTDYPYLNGYTLNFDTITTPDDRTVVLTLTEAVPNIEYLLSYLFILPQHVWQDQDPVEFENTAMIGTGPFKMKEYQQNQFVHLVANPDHWATPPKVDEVIFQTFENPDALVQAIKTGQVDAITEMTNTAVASLRNDPNVKLVIGAPFAPSVSDIILNQVAPENCPTADGGVCTGHPALRDRNVRLALAHATDKQKLIDVVLLGLGTPGLALIPDGLGQWYNSSLTDYAYDIARANQILDDAGYQDSDGDGVRELPDGSRPLTFRLNWPSDSVDAPRRAELLSDMWQQIGVAVEPQAVDPDALTAACCPAFDFDIMLWSWVSDPDPYALLRVMTTDQIPTGSSETGYANPRYDALFLEQSRELDLQKRIALVHEMQKIAHEDVVYIIPYYEQAVQAYRTDRFQGWITDAGKVQLEDVSSLVIIEPVR